jgi:hypothetical protein
MFRKRFVPKSSGCRQFKKNKFLPIPLWKTLNLARAWRTNECYFLTISTRWGQIKLILMQHLFLWLFIFSFSLSTRIKDYWCHSSVLQYRIFSIVYRGPVRRGQILQCVIGVLEVHKISNPPPSFRTQRTLSAQLPTSSGEHDNKSRTGDLIKSSIEVAISGEKRKGRGMRKMLQARRTEATERDRREEDRIV